MSASSSRLPTFPDAQQAQIIRANQRDLFHVASLREQAESVLRSWLGTRWLTRWDKEVELAVKLMYYGLSVGRAVQTLGEEYTDIWEYSSDGRTPSRSLRAALILFPTLPSYVLARWGSHIGALNPKVGELLKALQVCLEVGTEINLAVFYLRGTYYDLVKRVLGIRHVSSIPENPHVRPPSYSLLGILIAIRLLYRLVTFLRSRSQAASEKSSGKRSLDSTNEMFIDDRPVSTLLGVSASESDVKPAEEDKNTILDITSIPPRQRAGRTCTLCLEERTDSCATECGHLFCWGCIVGWGREKAECPLCRQALSLTRLLPIYNL
ncbi:Pex12 amino terminal region-domain-containing protein [Suillus subalutaceus]|uniref:Pex12 amino terminal region-domain-containing protein n=1 Tax=Suillus subalutaceus TaxID=48586 RepID=UPI001B87ECEB|nr:Pex12 amino terminal region-domain-containing protein [Suillus subalutaceus]KAG1841308.1 Pex12 amino terminal region-domain-containing protein [Suillus subalutaceus]